MVFAGVLRDAVLRGYAPYGNLCNERPNDVQ